MDGKLSLHDPQTGKRLTQSARATLCTPIKLLRWKARLLPLSAAKEGMPASFPHARRGVSADGESHDVGM